MTNPFQAIIDVIREANEESMKPFHTCMDETAAYHARMQDEFERQRKRDMVRRKMRECIAVMKENDVSFLMDIISVTKEELGAK
jgi:hypothetical protein